MSYVTTCSQDDATFFYHRCIATIEGHTSYISSLAIGGHFLYTGSSDKKIRLWNRNGLRYHVDQENLANNMVITGNGAVKSIVVSADKLFSAHQDHKIRVWKISTDETQQNKLAHLATLPTLGDRALKILIPKHHVQVRRHKKSTWVHHLDTVSALALSDDGLYLYSVSWDKTLKVWQTTDFKCIESVGCAHDDSINALALSSNGDVYTGSTDKKIKIWRKTSKEEHTLVATLEKHKSGVNALALSTDQNILYSGGSDRLIVVWEKNINDGNMVAVGVLKGHCKSILCLGVVSDLVCSGSADETIRIWRRTIEKCYVCLGILEGHKGPVKCLTMVKDHDEPSDTSYLIYSGSLDCDIKVWQICIPST